MNFLAEEILIEKGRNIIPTIHMKDLISIISKIIEKKPDSYYIIAFDKDKNNSLLNMTKTIYDCVGDINKMIVPKEELNDDNNEENKNEEYNKINNEEINNIENKKESENETIEKKNEENNSIPEKKKFSFLSDKKYCLSKYFPRDLLYFIKLIPSEFIKGEPKKNYYNNEPDEENNLKLKLKEELIEYIPLFK